MRRLAVIFLLLYFGMGNILFPMGDMSFIRDLPQMYSRCAQEDPDINIADFVVEHLLNIHDNDDEPEEHEKPHQPVYHHVPAQTLITLNTFYVPHPTILFDTQLCTTYPLISNQGFLPGVLPGVFRPPALMA